MYVLLRRPHHGDGAVVQSAGAGHTHPRYSNVTSTRLRPSNVRSEDIRKVRESIQQENERMLRERLINAKAAAVYAVHAQHMRSEHVDLDESATHLHNVHLRVKPLKNSRKSYVRTLHRACKSSAEHVYPKHALGLETAVSSQASLATTEPGTPLKDERYEEPTAHTGSAHIERESSTKEDLPETDVQPSAGEQKAPYDGRDEAEIIRSAIADAITEASGNKPGWANQKSSESTSASSSFPSTPLTQRNQRRNVESSNEYVDESVEVLLESIRRSVAKQTVAARTQGRRPYRSLTTGASVVLKHYDPTLAGYGNEGTVTDEFAQEGLVEEELCTYQRVAVLGLGREGRVRRPKKKPLHEYYNDDDAELEALAKVVDPSAPRPEGAVINPARGDHATVPSSLPRSIDSALYRYGTSQPKMVAAIVLDHSGRPAYSLTYGKLLSRATKVAYMLLTRAASGTSGKDRVRLCKTGDRVALVYPNTEPLSFLVAFYGCLIAGVIPVPVEVPLTKRDAGIQQLGFLLGSCGVKVALTSDVCYKGLPKRSASGHTNASGMALAGSEVVDFKGWPRLVWLITEHLSKPSKDWAAPPRLTDESVAYVEYTTDREGSVKGVCMTRQAMLAHCRSITMAMGYTEFETMVSVLDFKREAGLWHSVLTSVFAGLRVIFVPYSLMKINPASWMLMVTRYQAKSALVKSRDLHWGLLATRDHKDINLSSLRSVLVADGANPWSLSSCDQFTAAFQSKGLRPDALCPCAGSSETGTISLRRPSTPDTASNTARGVLSMSALSHSVVRVDQENSLTSLTLQDAGQVIPGGVAVVVKTSGPPRLCRADEVGEICLYSHSTGSAYWALDGISASTFKVEPLGVDDRPLGPLAYVRSGLLGFLGPNGLVFVVGSRSSQMFVSGRQHSADDLIATVLAVEPMKFIYRGRIAVFSVRVLRDERICIVAEQKPGVSEEDSFSWMSRVLQAIDSIHQVGIYCLALVPPNHLPKTPLGGIHVSETRQRFLDGNLHPATLLMCPHSCVINLPKPREQQSDVGPAAMFVGNIVQGVRIAGAKGRDVGPDEDKSCLIEVLRQRAHASPDHVLFTQMNARGAEVDSVTCMQLLRKAERIGALLLDKGHLNVGDHVALIFPPGIDLIAAFYGCQSAGLVPVCIRPPHPHNLQTTLPTVRMIVDVSKAVALLSTSAMIKLLRCKEASIRVDAKAWPTILDVDDVPSSSKRRAEMDNLERKPTDMCYLDFSVSTTGQLAGIMMSASGAAALCRSLKVACELYPSRHITLCLDPYCGLGFSLWCLSSVYSGHHSVLIPPSEVEQNPALWLTAVSQHKVRDTFCSYGVMELCVRELAPQITILKEKGVSLSCVRTCVVVAEERPRVQLCTAFTKLFSPLGLNARAVSTSFGCRVNTAICMQGAASPDPATVYVDARALRNDRVTLVEKGAPHSIALMESGKLLPGVRVVIANPETKGQCADSHLGEIWVAGPHNAAGYFTVYGDETSLHTDHFNARLSTGDTRTKYARTGYLGFLRQTQSITADGELHDAVFVVGALDEALMLRGMRYHPVDIEASVIRAHKKITECAVFTWTHLLVVVSETEGSEMEALDLIPAITSAVLEEHHLIVGVVVIVDPGTVPINSRGEKQRMHLRDAFLHDQLDPIYVAYNM
ncbi:Disco-interacting protein 2 -like protein C [Toxocara canis]|uniref:Disco-interacting protein 2-like protein C n=1 Tax=Toxocara canis TaxID=6265 RepID=A0A0B2V6K0_TOXCA|nr:Disco-interacting protein 2 -like protein C [Toxocara canis]